MRSNRHHHNEDTPINWRIFLQLWPYLMEFKTRVALALLCLIAAKTASIYLPFILKFTVDKLNQGTTNNAIVLVPFGLVAAYGLLRLANVLFGEIRDTLFGRVTERAMRRMALKVFQHLHQLSLDYHLSRQTGALQRDIERGTNGISFLMRFVIFNILPTLLELLLVVGILLANYPPVFAFITSLAVTLYVIYFT